MERVIFIFFKELVVEAERELGSNCGDMMVVVVECIQRTIFISAYFETR